MNIQVTNKENERSIEQHRQEMQELEKQFKSHAEFAHKRARMLCKTLIGDQAYLCFTKSKSKEPLLNENEMDGNGLINSYQESQLLPYISGESASAEVEEMEEALKKLTGECTFEGSFTILEVFESFTASR